MTDLLPCPFCGGQAKKSSERFERTLLSWVYCTSCGAAAGYRNTEAEAIAAWNTRYHSEFEETVIKAWKEIKDYQERTCRIVKTWSDSDYVDDWNYRCSECRGFIPVNERDPETGDVISAANYCPNCGAKVVSE